MPAQYKICWLKFTIANVDAESARCITVSASLLQQSGEDIKLRYEFTELLYGEIYQFYIYSVDIFYDLSPSSNTANVKLYHLSRPRDADAIVLSHKERIVEIRWNILLNDPKITISMFLKASLLTV